jgi:hypothetical protein
MQEKEKKQKKRITYIYISLYDLIIWNYWNIGVKSTCYSMYLISKTNKQNDRGGRIVDLIM